jgi:hypothetical protein
MLARVALCGYCVGPTVRSIRAFTCSRSAPSFLSSSASSARDASMTGIWAVALAVTAMIRTTRVGVHTVCYACFRRAGMSGVGQSATLTGGSRCFRSNGDVVSGSTRPPLGFGPFAYRRYAGLHDASNQCIGDGLFDWKLQITFRPGVEFHGSREAIVSSHRRI